MKTIKSLTLVVKNGHIQIKLRLKNGIEKFYDAGKDGHTSHSASVLIEVLKKDAIRFNDENMILDHFN